MDTSETGLEKIIVGWLVKENGYEQETPHAYNKDFALVDKWVERFVMVTQPEKVKPSMYFASPSERLKFFTRLSNEITKRGVTDVLRKGYKFNGSTFDLYYPLLSELNPSAKVAYEHNIFGVILVLSVPLSSTRWIDSIIDAVVVHFKTELNDDEQIKCKSALKNFNRCYPYFSAIMPYESPEWEKQYVFYSLLVKKLPKLKIDDYTDGLLDNIDFDKYRIVKEEERQIEELPARIATSVDFANAVRNGDKQVAQITFNDDIINIVASMLEEKTEFVQTYFANPDFQNFVNARVFQAAVSQLSNQKI